MPELKDFELDGNAITLKTPIKLDINILDDYYYASNEEIELYGNGATEEGAVTNARDVLSGLYILSKKIIECVEGGE